MPVSPNRWRHLEGVPFAAPVDVAWAAGLFDGEGCIGENHYDSRYGYRVILRLSMTHRGGVERFASIFPYGNIRARPARGVRIPFFAWCAAHQGWVGLILLRMRPYLTVKLAEADLALAHLGTYGPTPEQGAAFSKALRSHKTKGSCHLRSVK